MAYSVPACTDSFDKAVGGYNKAVGEYPYCTGWHPYCVSWQDKENILWNGTEKCAYNTAMPLLDGKVLKNEGTDVHSSSKNEWNWSVLSFCWENRLSSYWAVRRYLERIKKGTSNLWKFPCIEIKWRHEALFLCLKSVQEVVVLTSRATLTHHLLDEDFHFRFVLVGALKEFPLCASTH